MDYKPLGSRFILCTVYSFKLEEQTLPQFISTGDPPLRLLLMMLAYEAILLSWLTLYGYLVSRAGQSRFGTRVREVLQGVTGVVLIALGVRLAFEQK